MRRGFTLAEILITLTMIGVVSALTIPSLVGNIQDSQFKSAWKKAFADISQAHSQIMMDNGGTFAGAAVDKFSFRNLFQDKMNYITTCDDASCGPGTPKRLDNSAGSWSFVRNLILNNGVLISIFSLDSANCTDLSRGLSSGSCGWLLVDVNGKSGPNQWGKDVYGIWVLIDRILPWGSNPTGSAESPYIESTCKTSDSGYGCGARYLYN